VKKLLIFAALALGWFAAPVVPAQAQTPLGCGVNYNPVVGVNCANVRQPSYVGQILALAPAASATDIFCVDGSATKEISIRKIVLSGTATAAGSAPVSVIRRNALDTGGTSSVPNIGSLNVGNPTATAAVIQYTANPTINDNASHQTLRVQVMPIGTVAAPSNRPLIFEFGTQVDAYSQGASIPKGATTTQICINYGAATNAGNSLYGTVEWTEQ
jgi:hypothetical protein